MEDNIFNSWIAAFWEGEGSLCRIKGHIGYRVMICQSINPTRSVMPTMKKIQKIFDGHISTRKIKNYKSRIEWVLTRRKDVIRFIETIYPYCYIRKKDLENCLRYFETHPSLRWNKPIDLEKVKDLRIQGRTYKQIGEIFDVCAKTVFVKYRNHYSYKRQRPVGQSVV